MSFIKKIVQKIYSKFLVKIELYAEKIIQKKYFLIKKEFILEKKFAAYETFHLRPKLSNDVTTATAEFVYPKTALVLQGPIIAEDDFTLETIRIYKKHFPNVLIILSTWKDSNTSEIAKIERENVIILLSQKPDNFGISNINLQIVSSYNGIMRAKQENCQYVFKTRTDQRMYAPNILAFLFALLKKFPLYNESIQKERIIATSLNTFKKRIYGISDMWSFGTVTDMCLLWGCALDERKNEFALKLPSLTMSDMSKHNICEVYVTSDFLKKIGKKLLWTIEDSHRYYCNNFIIVDPYFLDLFWKKYTNMEYRWLMYETSDFEEYTFKDWLTQNMETQ